jgi:hypothetical protein
MESFSFVFNMVRFIEVDECAWTHERTLVAQNIRCGRVYVCVHNHDEDIMIWNDISWARLPRTSP